MRPENRTETKVTGNAEFASLTDVSFRRSTATHDKKSDITDALASMRVTPEYLHPEPAPARQEMRDVTPPVCSDIISFWNSIRTPGAMPSRESLKASELARQWPNSILFRCTSPGEFSPDTAFGAALRAHRGRENAGAMANGVEMMAMLSQRMLSAVHNAAGQRSPFRDRSHLESGNGSVFYEVVAMPFGEDEVDHVLCNVDFT
jgi:hypothetical protein